VSAGSSSQRTVPRKAVIAAAAVLIVAIVGLVYLLSSGVGRETGTSAATSITTMVPGQPTMLSYNFQVNSTGGSLYVVLKNYEDNNLSVSNVYLDLIPLATPPLSLGSGCNDFVLGTECSISYTYGASQDRPTNGTTHSLEMVTVSGVEFSYYVTVGVLYHAQCTYTSTC
jgi:hypothetical protein